jgi:hypothetical protein
MLRNFQLAAISENGDQTQLQRIPMLQNLQQKLAETWGAQLEAFLDQVQEIPFNAGYQPEDYELFSLTDFEPPQWLSAESSRTIGDLDPIDQDEEAIASTKGIAGFARNEAGVELVLFQNFSRSHVIRPGTFLLLKNGTYETTERPGLTLDTKLAAVYMPTAQKLLFHSFRVTNTFLPLGDFYQEASEQQIREVLAHEKLAPINVDALANKPSQWFKRRFAMLRGSGVLDKYSTKQIRDRSMGYDVEIEIKSGRIVFPEDRLSAKKLLQFLNEELFKGAITDTLYETNSKREAD